MMKIKKGNVVLTLAAFAALVFLLPPDKKPSNNSENQSQSSFSLQGNTTKAHQQQSIRGNFLLSA